jgi:FkbM family methyltransferase
MWRYLDRTLGAHFGRRGVGTWTAYRIARKVLHLYNNNNIEMDRNGEYWLQSVVLSDGHKLVLDVGANKGEWIQHALQINRKLTGYALEPAPSTFTTLVSHVHCDRLHAHQLALSDAAGTLSLWFSEAHHDMTSVVNWSEQHPDPGKVSQIRVPCLTGDRFCEEQRIKHIDFLKIDAEGHDFAVLRGFEKKLRSNDVDWIQFEYNEFSFRAGSSLRQIFSFLSDDFLIGRLLPNGIELYEYSGMLEDFHQSNFVALSKRAYAAGLANKVNLRYPKGYLGLLCESNRSRGVGVSSTSKLNRVG